MAQTKADRSAAAKKAAATRKRNEAKAQAAASNRGKKAGFRRSSRRTSRPGIRYKGSMSEPPGDVLALCYHAVSTDWEYPGALESARLEQQLVRLLRDGWEPASFTEAVTAPPSRRTLAVTFDDGLRSVVELAAPVLAGLGIPGTAFVATGFIGKEDAVAWRGLERWAGTPHETELAPMGWDDLAALHDAGWEIGSHSVDHRHLTTLSDAGLAAELGDSRAAIAERLGTCTSIAYPYGDVDCRVVDAARAAGYTAGAGVLPDHHGGEPLRFPRVFVSREDSDRHLRLRLTRPMRVLQSTRLWAASGPGARSRPN